MIAQPIRYLDVCSGYSAATLAWHDLGFECVGYAEIEPAPAAVLAHRWGAGRPIEMPDPDEPGLSRKEAKARAAAIKALDQIKWGERIRNFGDFTKIRSEDVGPIDLLVGGTPCQSFSIAGLRIGLADARGNLALEFLRLLGRTRPRWVVWENVPGIFSSATHDSPDPSPPAIDLDSDDGPRDGEEILVEDSYDADESHALACFLAGLSELGYGWAYRVIDAQFTRVDGHPGAVPQRRRRLFVVGHLGAGAPAGAVLFDRESMRGTPPPRRVQGKGATHDVAPSLVRSGRGVERLGDTKGRDPVVAFALNEEEDGDVAGTLPAHDGGYSPEKTYVAIAEVAPTLRAMNETDGHPNGGGQIAIAIQERALRESDHPQNGSGIGEDGVAFALEAAECPQGVLVADVGVYDTTQITSKINRSSPQPGDPCHPLTAEGNPPLAVLAFPERLSGTQHATSLNVAPVLQAENPTAIAFKIGAGAKAGSIGLAEELSPTLGAAGSGTQRSPGVLLGYRVRRLTPKECERLQGAPDGFTLVPYRRGRMMADGPRYKMVGNSMPRNVMRWIGRGLAEVDRIIREAA